MNHGDPDEQEQGTEELVMVKYQGDFDVISPLGEGAMYMNLSLGSR